MKFLPQQPNLKFLHREARVLKSRHRARDERVCQIIGHFDISFHGYSSKKIFNQRFSILDAQRVVARQYGFASWTRLKAFVLGSIRETKYHDVALRNQLLHRNHRLDELTKKLQRQQKARSRRTSSGPYSISTMWLHLKMRVL